MIPISRSALEEALAVVSLRRDSINDTLMFYSIIYDLTFGFYMLSLAVLTLNIWDRSQNGQNAAGGQKIPAPESFRHVQRNAQSSCCTQANQGVEGDPTCHVTKSTALGQVECS
jgi:hypothetical protein